VEYLIIIIKVVFIIVPLLIAVAYFTLVERKILGAMQRRKGPNVVGAFGTLQPLADGFKLLVKEFIKPSSSNTNIFIIAPILTFTLSMMGWAVVPFSKHSFLIDFNIGILYILAASSLGVYGIIMSGWSSNSKYAILGALRSAAQMISYEIAISIIVATIAVSCSSFNLQDIIDYQVECWFFITFLPISIIFFIAGLAETNRHPFDLPEAEAELVSGYNVEYSGIFFALFSLGEYFNMLMYSSFTVILFFGGWLPVFYLFDFLPGSLWFALKICIFVILFIVARGALPRYRYNQLMTIGWKGFVPFTLFYFIYSIFMTRFIKYLFFS
jgi:NADH-quinone oxidoreductase subunit H